MNESDRYDPSTILKSYTQATDFSPQCVIYSVMLSDS